MYAAANDACKALGINAVFGSTREGANTECDLRCVTRTSGDGWKTILPHEVKLATEVGIGDTIHYADAAYGTLKEAVRLPLAQCLMYLVEEEATYAVLSTKVHWTFMKRGPSPSQLHISRTYNAEKEPGAHSGRTGSLGSKATSNSSLLPS
ncbi:hypothetical protein WJX74_003747 [Apatococcus lobatus]|uniref:Transposase n=1 Tax=Apatococcus lobatus TaxID=904363 RepID=A0AAW1QTT3_9CHLO